MLAKNYSDCLMYNMNGKNFNLAYLIAGADVNYFDTAFGNRKNEMGSLLTMAIFDDDEAIFDQIIDSNKCDPEIPQYPNYKDTNLIYAASDPDRLRYLRRLIEIKADINKIGDCDKTALLQATMENNVPGARLLLQNGARPDHHKLVDWQALHHACCNDNLELVQLLLDNHADVDSIGEQKNSQTPLMIASESASIEVISALLAADADPNIKND